MNNTSIGNYPLYFTSLNCEYKQESISRPNGFKSEQLMFILSGDGILSVDGKSYPLYPNTAVFFGSDVSHSYSGYTEDFTTAWISFRGEMLPFLHGYFNVGRSLVYYNADTQKYLEMMRMLEEEYNTQARESMMSSILYRLLTEFFSLGVRQEETALEKAELYIIRNFSKQIFLDELTQVAGVSKSKFCALARQHWNMTAFERIMDVRLMHAKSLLEKNEKIRLSECADMCGFNDVSYFCKSYKKKFGVSPKNKTNGCQD